MTLDILEDAAPATRRVPLCLDAAAETEWRRARQAKAKGNDDADEWEAAAAEAAAAKTVVVEVRALSFPEVQDVIDKWPPRIKDGDYDRLDLTRGYNRRMFKPALVQAAIVDPDLSDADWSRLLRHLTNGQFTVLFETVDRLAQRITPSDLDFGSAASEQTQD